MGTAEGLKSRLQRVGWVIAVLLPVFAVVLATTWLSRGLQAAAPQVPAEVAGLESFQRGFAWVVQQVKPSVAFIEVEQKVEPVKDNANGGAPDLRDLLPDLPFSLPNPRPRPQEPQGPGIPVGQGSGIIFDRAGYILTNNHVIEKAVKITVHLVDGESYPARLMGTDPLTDLAVIKIDPKHALTPAVLGDADQLQVGSWAIAVGYPFGGGEYGGKFDEPLHFEPTITVGVISAQNRQLPSDTPNQYFRDLIQTDAPINPGNSGGPLVNIRAQVIGINQAIYTNSPLGGNIGVGFAIPINERTKSVIETLKGGQSVVRGRVGLLVAPLTESKKSVYNSHYKTDLSGGVFVEKVEPRSPAARAGFKQDDIIVSLNGKPVASQDDFVTAVQSTKPGNVISIAVLRDGKELTLKPKVVALAAAVAERKVAAVEPQKLGLTVEEAPPELLQKAQVEGGVRVTAVESVSDGARAGIHQGDLIVSVNFQPVTGPESYREAVGALKPGDPVVIRVWRNGDSFTVEIPSVSE